MTSNRIRALELLLWVAVVAGTIVIGSALVAFVFGDGLLTLKYILFVVGFLLFGLGSFGIQPKRPTKETKRITVDSDIEYRFEARIQDLPPLRDTPLPISDRVSRDIKVFLTSLVVLGVSLVLEFGLGVTR